MSRIRTTFVGAFLLVACLASYGAQQPATAASQDYLTELVQRARAEGLADHPQWHRLLHYQPSNLGGVASLIDSPSFFAAHDGKANPEAELEATIASFFHRGPAAAGEQHPQCLRIARYRWLKAQLRFDPARLAEQACPVFEEWLRTLDAGGVTLSYPSAYLNNPSSMFGHTLLRLDRRGQTEQTRLLSFAVNFAADTGPEGGALFALKGLAGGYRGYFSVMPYYEKVNPYSDIENRDIWEYKIRLKPEEIQIMLEHLWEVDEQYVNYYFLSTNCSYVVLSLINTARPDLDLMKGLDLYAIPIDTVRSVIRQAGLLDEVAFRPSGMTRVNNLRDRLDDAQRELAIALAAARVDPGDPELAAYPSELQARILELAQNLLQYRLNTETLDRDVVAPRSLRLLRARAGIPTVSKSAGGDAGRPAVRPDEGHDSVRLGAGFGMTGANPFLEVGLRPAYHDLVDPPAGYPTGAGIEILGVRLRYYPDELPTVEDFTVVGINSLSPRDEFVRPLSWRIKLGVERFRDDADDMGWPVGLLEGGAGGTWRLGGNATVSALVDASLFADGGFPETRILGIGPAFAMSWPITSWWTTNFDARWLAVTGSDRLSERYDAHLRQGFHVSRNLSLRLDAGIRNDGGDPYSEWMTSLQWYF